MWRFLSIAMRHRYCSTNQYSCPWIIMGAAALTSTMTLIWWQQEQLLQQQQNDDYRKKGQESRTTAASVYGDRIEFYSAMAVQQLLRFMDTTMSTMRQSSKPVLCESSGGLGFRITNLRRHRTIQRMEKTAEKETIESKYQVDWENPLGEGSFGKVFPATERATGEPVAVKKINKTYTDNVAFQREMDALLHLRQHNGHPNICGLRANYDEPDFYYLVLDLVTGGEMFDALCADGAYSESDAARLVREVANALHFMHGIGIVHGDLKPENLMLSSANSSEAVIKVVDFGCAQTTVGDDLGGVLDPIPPTKGGDAATPAYSPPEIIEQRRKARKTTTTRIPVEPSFDMWALGVIVYIMLTGVHPFDLQGNSTDKEIEDNILAHRLPPLRNSSITAHLSKDAIDLIEGLLQWKPKHRLTAQQLLNNPWVQGGTARTKKMTDSDKRLSTFRAFRSKLEAKVFSDLVAMSYRMKKKSGEITKRTSLIEQAFHRFDPSKKGYVTTSDLERLSGQKTSDSLDEELSFSSFSDLLSEHMKNRYFPKGHVLYHKGDRGDCMYFVDSGTIELYANDFKETIHSGDFFGAGALLSDDGLRSASARCLTPVHVIEVSREYLEKYMAQEHDTVLNLREIDKARKHNRAKTILRLQQQMEERKVDEGKYFYSVGGDGNQCYVLEHGRVDIMVKNHKVFRVQEGEMFGEQGVILGQNQNTDAKCVSKEGCKVHLLRRDVFAKMLETHPSLKNSVRDTCYRREFQKAICMMTKRPFPTNEKDLRRAFDAVDRNSSGVLELRNVRNAIMRLDPTFTENDVHDILDSLDLDRSGTISWPEFKRIFGYSNEEDD